MEFGTNGQWGWWASGVAHGLADQWENPGGGFGFCPSWCPLGAVDVHAESFQAALVAGRARGE